MKFSDRLSIVLNLGCAVAAFVTLVFAILDKPFATTLSALVWVAVSTAYGMHLRTLLMRAQHTCDTLNQQTVKAISQAETLIALVEDSHRIIESLSRDNS